MSRERIAKQQQRQFWCSPWNVMQQCLNFNVTGGAVPMGEGKGGSVPE